MTAFVMIVARGIENSYLLEVLQSDFENAIRFAAHSQSIVDEFEGAVTTYTVVEK